MLTTPTLARNRKQQFVVQDEKRLALAGACGALQCGLEQFRADGPRSEPRSEPL